MTLIQTSKIRDFPVILMGQDYWRPVMDVLERMVQERTISSADLNLLYVTDVVEEAMAHIREHAIERFGLRRRRVPHRSTFLGE